MENNNDDIVKDVKKNGLFYSTLIRNNQQIRKDRAEELVDAVEVIYRRAVEDIQFQIKSINREKSGMIDLSPTNATQLTHSADFNPQAFVEKDISLSLEIRKLEIKLEEATKRYQELFGKDIVSI